MNEFGDQNGMVYVVEVLTEIQETDTKIFCGLLETGESVKEHITQMSIHRSLDKPFLFEKMTEATEAISKRVLISYFTTIIIMIIRLIIFRYWC